MWHLSRIKIQQGNRGASESKCPFSDFFKNRKLSIFRIKSIELVGLFFIFLPSLTETKDLCYTINCVHSISEEIETTFTFIHSPKTRFRKDDDYRMLTKEAILKRPELQQIVQKY